MSSPSRSRALRRRRRYPPQSRFPTPFVSTPRVPRRAPPRAPPPAPRWAPPRGQGRRCRDPRRRRLPRPPLSEDSPRAPSSPPSHSPWTYPPRLSAPARVRRFESRWRSRASGWKPALKPARGRCSRWSSRPVWRRPLLPPPRGRRRNASSLGWWMRWRRFRCALFARGVTL